MGETVNSSHVVEIEGSTSFNNDTTAIIADDILMDEILPRLPIKSPCRFKLVCKQWNNFITHPSHRFAISHHRYASKNLSNSAYFFNEQTERVVSIRDDPHHHFKMSNPTFIKEFYEIRGSKKYFRCIRGSNNGLLFGLFADRDIFICNPITKHVDHVPNPNPESSTSLYIALLFDTQKYPYSGFKIVAMNNKNFDDSWLGFVVYYSKNKEWRQSDAVVQVIPSESEERIRPNNPIFAGGKVYWSYVRHIVWFDVEKDQAGSIECPGKDNLIFVHGLYCYFEIGVCDGELSYSKATNEGNIEIWLLKSKSGDYVGLEFEWVKIFNLSLEEIFQENWNVVSKFFWTRKSRTPKKAAEFSTKKRAILPLPCLDKEVVWFRMNFWLKEYCRNRKLFYINIRSRELKLLDGDFSFPQYLFSASFLSCPT
ncbi:hypothetical protein Sjap_005460 [Stephania japonica]|uniref:F-box domain-containing protein n=1 Tax=Stephania japonica TaxID=461633 RepID=A0AAP0K456_9MAGN